MDKTQRGTVQRRRRVRGFAIFGSLILLLALLASPLTETQSQGELRRALTHVGSLFDSKTHGSGATMASLELVRAKGLPKALAGLKMEAAIAAPDRLWISTTIEKQLVEIGRNGNQIWIWQPSKVFGLVGERGVPKFSSSPETSGDDTQLGPFTLPCSRMLLPVLPRLLSVEKLESEEIDGERCHALRARPWPVLARWIKTPAGTLTVRVRERDGWPVQVAYEDGGNVDALLAISGLRVGHAVPESRWQMPAPAGANVEKVALSHLSRFFDAALKIAKLDVPPLGPASGERTVVATHGKGRLELQDGTRVLFLRGTPEEMGEQQGTLMKGEVRGLVDHLLYGVGVGSSFAKGRWFFGEIEACTARIGPFIDPRYLREMDAMAVAAGVEKEEMRLANFFPELFHCSGFALMGDATSGRRIYHGRVLDYLRGVGLEGNAVVTVNQPDQGHSWVNVGYAGFTGSVTAMNDQHISIGEMGGRGEGNWDGKPMAQLVREVMEKASTLDAAVEIMRRGPRTCEYFYVIADGRNHTAVGIAATPDTFEIVRPGEAHPRLPTAVRDAVLLSAGDRYTELVRRVQAGHGQFDADSARELMTKPVCMNSNIHSVLFAPDTLDFWVANADSRNIASETRYTRYNLKELLNRRSGFLLNAQRGAGALDQLVVRFSGASEVEDARRQ